MGILLWFPKGSISLIRFFCAFVFLLLCMDGQESCLMWTLLLTHQCLLCFQVHCVVSLCMFTCDCDKELFTWAFGVPVCMCTCVCDKELFTWAFGVSVCMGTCVHDKELFTWASGWLLCLPILQRHLFVHFLPHGLIHMSISAPGVDGGPWLDNSLDCRSSAEELRTSTSSPRRLTDLSCFPEWMLRWICRHLFYLHRHRIHWGQWKRWMISCHVWISEGLMASGIKHR